MPRPFEFFPVLFGQPLKLVQCASREAVIVRQGYGWMQPEFGFALSLQDMDMWRFTRVPLVRIEQEAEAVDPEHNGHEVDHLSSGLHPVTSHHIGRLRLAARGSA